MFKEEGGCNLAIVGENLASNGTVRNEGRDAGMESDYAWWRRRMIYGVVWCGRNSECMVGVRRGNCNSVEIGCDGKEMGLRGERNCVVRIVEYRVVEVESVAAA